MKNVAAVISTLHEPPHGAWSGVRLFRETPVLAWTLKRLAQSQQLHAIAILCWDDQKSVIETIAGPLAIIRSKPRQAISEIESVAASQRWADGWRGGLLATCSFDLGFYAPWHHELAQENRCDGIVVVDPSAALVDASLIDGLIEHARADDTLEYCFAPAAPGLCGLLIRPALLNRLAAAKAHPGRMMHYHPDQTSREPIASANCIAIPAPIARTTHRFTLDSDRQIDRIDQVTEPLNGQLIHSSAEDLVRRSHSTGGFGLLPREIVLELTTRRATHPVYSADRLLDAQRRDLSLQHAKTIFNQLSESPGTRVTLAGVGDPLLHEQAFDIIRMARLEGSATINIETDLVDIDDAHLEHLAVCEADVISVSIPALSPRTYAAVMGRDALASALDNIRKLLAMRNRRGAVPIIATIFTKCRQNQAEMEPWYDQWIRALGAAVVRGPSDFCGKIPDAAIADMAPPGRRPCARIAARLVILSNGTVVPCEQDVCGAEPVGEVGIDRISDIWRGRMQSLRNDHVAGRYASNSLCGACREWHRP